MLIGMPARRILIERRPAGLESVGTAAADWTVATPPIGGAAHPWDLAHQAVRQPAAVGWESARAPNYAEPDFVQAFPFPRPDVGGIEGAGGPWEDPCSRIQQSMGVAKEFPAAAYWNKQHETKKRTWLTFRV
jgi:hypothetical protein